MTPRQTTGTGLSHPTVVPANGQGNDEDVHGTADGERCPECGRPVEDHEQSGW